MKQLFTLVFSFLSLCICAQQKNTHEIKIYLEDAETGKNIDDAKVTLEGFEIPAITGQYDKKGKYYYFDKIPPGYNTIMSYHKKYNEKGFQNLEGLPRELKLRLYDPNYVSYSFEKPKLKNFGKDYSKEDSYLRTFQNRIAKGKEIENINFKYLYNEDPFHIAIITKYSYKDFFSSDSIKNLLNELSLEYTKYKSGTEKRYTLNMYQFSGGRFFKNQYTEIEIQQYGSQPPYGFNCYNVFFFHKKDTTKFDRFNSKEIKELRKFNLTVAAISNRVIEYYANSNFRNESFEELYNHNIYTSIYQYSIGNYDFGKLSIPEKIFFKNSKKESEMYFGDKKYKKVETLNGDSSIEALFFIIPKNQNSRIGLGAIDADINETNFQDRFYFFNTVPNDLKIIK
ncbi:hypothetical protein [Flavobacterium acetivorans]|uniref:hypothetical protein n=1 Tax=Flavobacterium acetivorans TaxID=2893883 RepID=UPI001E5F245C|nr:hypothetical protein [Flavobacterium sp. F-29]UFH35060.1 hypothetical protein LNP19_13345 [Flavobacterium sp. F-29]